MSCPYCEDYADYQAILAAEAEAEYQYQQERYISELLVQKKYDLFAFEFVIDRIYSKLCKEDQKLLSETRNEISKQYNKESEIKEVNYPDFD